MGRIRALIRSHCQKKKKAERWRGARGKWHMRDDARWRTNGFPRQLRRDRVPQAACLMLRIQEALVEKGREERERLCCGPGLALTVIAVFPFFLQKEEPAWPGEASHVSNGAGAAQRRSCWRGRGGKAKNATGEFEEEKLRHLILCGALM